MTIKVVFNHLPEIARRLPREAREAVKETALEIEADAKTSMAEQKSGVIYPRGRKTHQASAPGEAPAIDTGHLVNSIHMEMTGPATAEVRAEAEYAAPLEFGSNRMAPRPFFAPAAGRARPRFLRRMIELVNR